MKSGIIILLVIFIGGPLLVLLINQLYNINNKLTVNTPLLDKLLNLNAVYNLLPTVMVDLIDPSFNAAKAQYYNYDISVAPVVVTVQEAQIIKTDTTIHDTSMSTVRYTGCDAYRLQSNDYTTVITPEMINCLDLSAAVPTPPPDTSLPYRWQHRSSNKCIMPYTINNQTALVFKSECPNEDNAKYKFMTNGQIQHIATGKFLHTWNNYDIPIESEALKLDIDNIESDKVKFNLLPNGQIQHKSSGMCIHPRTGGDNPDDNVVLSLRSDCSDSNNAIKFSKI